MSVLKFPVTAMKSDLDYIVSGRWNLIGCFFRLFVNDFDPAAQADFTPADFTEATFAGYAGIQPPTFSAAIAVGDSAYVANATLVYTCTINGAPEDVYGWYLHDVNLGIVRMARRFDDGPYTIDTAGQQVSFTPALNLLSPS